MDVLVRRPSPLQYSLDTAHTIEVTREEDENGDFGSFGFTLLYDNPPIVGTIVPGGPAQRAGLKKDDIVLSVNGVDVTRLPHQKVVSFISQTSTAGVWLKVCDSDTKTSSGGLGPSLGAFSSMSSSTPNFTRGMPLGGSQRRSGVQAVGGAVWEPPPKYSEVPPSRLRPGSGLANAQLGTRAGQAVVSASVANMSPLNRQVLKTHTKSNLTTAAALGGSGPLPQNGYAPTNPRPPAHNNCYTSASVMVLYIGPVEIPETWSMRGISSKCIQECTRRLLSQRQEFIEAFLEVSTSSMKVLNVSRNVLYRHKREELFYCGTCTDDEQYFAIVTRKIDPKLVDPEVGQTLHVPAERPIQAHICHVFQVIRNKSILVLHAGDCGGSGDTPNIKPKTVQILSCLTIIKAIEALFIGDATGGTVSSAQLFGESAGNNSSNTSFRSIGSSESNHGSSESFPMYGTSPEKAKKKKDVVDLRPSAFTQPHSSPLTYASSAAYTAHEAMNRSRDYLHPMDTPAFSNMGSTSSRSWYKVDSPKEAGVGGHSRQGSYELGVGRPDSGGTYYDLRYDVAPHQIQQQSEASRRAVFDKVKKISDESSISSHSSGGGGGGGGGGGKVVRSSHSPSLSKSPSYSSGSRSPSPSHSRHHHHQQQQHYKQQQQHHRRHHDRHHQQQQHHRHHRHHQGHSPVHMSRGMGHRRTNMAYYTPSKLSAGMALEVASSRSGAISPTSSTVDSVSRFRSTLRRQGSESSIMDLHQVDTMRSGGGLPAKNSLLTSSHGSVMTVTTVAEEGEGGKGEEEVGRVGGWIASFDKLLRDPLGVMCLQQFLEREHCEENILFYKDTQEFSEKAQQMTSVQMQATAKKIYDQYLSPSSPHTVNVDDRALKAVESTLDSPAPSLFAEAQEQVYQLLKMDCYMRFKKSELVKECLLADMQGDPLPIGPAPPIAKNPWKKQKELGFSRSLFNRFVRHRVPPSPPLPQTSPKSKKDSKASLRDSPGSRKTSRDPSFEKKRSSAELTRTEEFPPETHLDILQVHKGNIFEVNLPNKVTKIMEVPKKGTVREAIDPILKKNSYSLNVMDLKFADTLKAVSLDSPAHILIGQHIIVLKSAQTFVATFPEGVERILPAGKQLVQDLVASVLNEMGTLQNFAVYLENSRVPFNCTIEASTLLGQKVNVKYLGGQYVPADSNMDDLFCMIERLAGDTLEDQRTSPTPRNTPEPSPLSPASSGGTYHPPEPRQRTRTHGNSFHGLSPQSSDSSPETRSKKRGNSTRGKKKPLTATLSIGKVSSSLKPPGGAEDLKFKCTQSGVVVNNRQKKFTDFKRTYSPPASLLNSDRKPSSPPPPTSRPPPLPSTFHQHQHQQQQYRVHRSSDELHHPVAGSSVPKYFPRATLSTDQLPMTYGSTPETLNSGGRGRSPGHQRPSPSSTPSSDHAHPLDSLVQEASTTLPSTSRGTSTTGNHGRQHSMPVQMSSYMTSYYPWHQAEPPTNPHRHTQQHASRTAAQRHDLTLNPELMRTADKLVQKEIEDYRHHQFTSSSHSDGSAGSMEPRLAASPTTHILLAPPEDDHSQTETFV